MFCGLSKFRTDILDKFILPEFDGHDSDVKDIQGLGGKDMRSAVAIRLFLIWLILMASATVPRIIMDIQ